MIDAKLMHELNSLFDMMPTIPPNYFTLVIYYMAKSIGTCKKNPYIINQNHIFSKNYCEVISGWILTNFTPKHSELSIFCLFICSLCLYELFLFLHNLKMIVNF